MWLLTCLFVLLLLVSLVFGGLIVLYACLLVGFCVFVSLRMHTNIDRYLTKQIYTSTEQKQNKTEVIAKTEQANKIKAN